MSVDKETQMTPQKANTPLRETMPKEKGSTVVPPPKTSTKKKKKKKLFEYDKARLYPPVPGMTEEEMLRSGPVCKDFIRSIMDRCVHAINVGGYILTMVASIDPLLQKKCPLSQ